MAALAGLLAGCAPSSFDRLPRQDEAERIVWRELYQEEQDPPPIEWFDGLILDTRGQQVAGMTLPGWKCMVSREDVLVGALGAPVTLRQFSQTGYAHELMHAHTYNRTGDIDAAHWRGDWDLADHGAFVALDEAGL